ncbi:hypothetical protein DERP_001467 [Dermatophagoides pteronyssinus]|uniref:Uncharacterized protein n=1 Tax=Dermatophagoides pteronyssinus TaxID=6956 RepID=A0ABQ8JEI7_DERPT|nr:hypothetical protein DERP_001467 [Dermatophagoides pteronyssinus]
MIPNFNCSNFLINRIEVTCENFMASKCGYIYNENNNIRCGDRKKLRCQNSTAIWMFDFF